MKHFQLFAAVVLIAAPAITEAAPGERGGEHQGGGSGGHQGGGQPSRGDQGGGQRGGGHDGGGQPNRGDRGGGQAAGDHRGGAQPGSGHGEMRPSPQQSHNRPAPAPGYKRPDAPSHGGNYSYNRPPPGERYWNHSRPAPRGGYWTSNRWNQRPVYAPSYFYPRGYSYRRWSPGLILPLLFLSSNYYFDGYEIIGLPQPYGCRWVRYGPDLLLVEVRTGRIRDVRYGVFE